jgi:hypothetical protein
LYFHYMCMHCENYINSNFLYCHHTGIVLISISYSCECSVIIPKLYTRHIIKIYDSLVIYQIYMFLKLELMD